MQKPSPFFNYGRALGAPVDNAEYNYATEYSKNLGKVNLEFSQNHWRLIMAIREVRLATDATEQAAAMAKLKTVWHEVEAALAEVRGQTGYKQCLRFFRWGRFGTVKTGAKV